MYRLIIQEERILCSVSEMKEILNTFWTVEVVGKQRKN